MLFCAMTFCHRDGCGDSARYFLSVCLGGCARQINLWVRVCQRCADEIERRPRIARKAWDIIERIMSERKELLPDPDGAHFKFESIH